MDNRKAFMFAIIAIFFSIMAMGIASDTTTTIGNNTTGTTDHANLTNLNWGAANHTIDSNITMNGNSITGIDTIGLVGQAQITNDATTYPNIPAFMSLKDEFRIGVKNLITNKQTLHYQTPTEYSYFVYNGNINYFRLFETYAVLHQPLVAEWLNPSESICTDSNKYLVSCSKTHTKRIITSNSTIVLSDENIFLNSTQSINITLPSAINNNGVYTIKRIDNMAANTIFFTFGSASGDDYGYTNQMLLQNFSINGTTTIGQLSFYITTAAGNGMMGLYDTSGLIVNSSASVLTVGWNNFTIPPTTLTNLTNGVYKSAMSFSSGSAHTYYSGTGGGGRCIVANVFGSLPSSTPCIPTGSGVNHWGYKTNVSTVYIVPIDNQLIERMGYKDLMPLEHITIGSDDYNWYII